MNEVPIGKVAKEFKVDNARLRDWCKKGLIHAEMRSNARYIPESEFDKIKFIRDFFDQAKKAGTRVTFDDVRRELNNRGIIQEKKEEEKLNEIVSLQAEALEKALGGEQLFKSIEYMGTEVKRSKEETISLIADQYQAYTELVTAYINQREEENKYLKEKLNNMSDKIDEMHGAYMAAASDKDNEVKTEPGFFKKLFGRRE
ncbi:hypothetical protein CHH49_18080 [Terribacillus saccharophilus]|uniref:MerR family transcriptional regulator n=1 Tax=Terribacillus saccharophilus TaxID=361277 RepID=UPI000BA5EC17|nr:MerR family transcriptional regulator [Terribacillus saccharophilus]PAF20055.1 hypothetical protein CHH49_18080 [Terribacillus saccharophilus]